MYPIFAVAYGSFGLGFGLYLWWRTQKRIERTSTGIATRVAAAVTDIKGQVEGGLNRVESSVKAEVADIDRKIGLQIDEVKRTVDSLPDITPEDLSLDIDELSASLGPALMEHVGPAISEHVTMAVLQLKAQETKQIQAMLEEAGLDKAVEGMGAEAQQALLGQMNYGQQAAMKIMSMKPSKKWEKDHPFGTVGFEMFKGAQVELLAALQGVGKQSPGRGVIESARFAPGEV